MGSECEFSVFSFQCSESRTGRRFPMPTLTLVFDLSPLHSFEISNLKSQIRAAQGGHQSTAFCSCCGRRRGKLRSLRLLLRS